VAGEGWNLVAFAMCFSPPLRRLSGQRSFSGQSGAKRTRSRSRISRRPSRAIALALRTIRPTSPRALRSRSRRFPQRGEQIAAPGLKSDFGSERNSGPGSASPGVRCFEHDTARECIEALAVLARTDDPNRLVLMEGAVDTFATDSWADDEAQLRRTMAADPDAAVLHAQLEQARRDTIKQIESENRERQRREKQRTKRRRRAEKKRQAPVQVPP
jgi:hypothetical protein